VDASAAIERWNVVMSVDAEHCSNWVATLRWAMTKEVKLRVAVDGGEHILRFVRDFDEPVGHLLAGFARPFDQAAGESDETRRARDHARLLFDLDGIEI